MQQVIEKEISLDRISVLLVNIQWGAVQEFRPEVPGYYLCQRLSDQHSALRFENLAIREAFPHVRSVGLLPPTFAVRVLPPESPFRALNCVFDQDLFESTTEIDSDRWSDYGGALIRLHNNRLSTMMQQIYNELERPAFGADLMIEATSTMILVEMARHFEEFIGRPLGEFNHARGGLAPWQLRRIRDRIQSSLEIGYPCLAELAELCGISQGHLMRAFKISTGARLHQFITEERIKAARQMLREDRLGNAEISGHLGFSSPAYFATAFRRQTGMTPTDFRTLSRAGKLSGELL